MVKRGRPQAKGYSEAGASHTRRALKGFTPNSGSPQEDIDFNNKTLRQRARMLYMAAPLATSAINTNRTKVVGIGLALKAAVDREVLGISEEAADRWQRKTKAEFELWANKKANCDALGLNTFAELQSVALMSWLTSGDVFALIKREDPTALNPYSLRIHLIEADRISTPSDCGSVYPHNTAGVVPEGKPGAGNKIYDGVEVDKSGKVIAYYICNRYPSEIISDGKEWKRIEVIGKKTGLPNILPIMNTERPDQYRGVSYLAQIIEPLLQIRRYTESELTAALIQSFFTAWIETTTNPADIPFNEVGEGNLYGVPEGSDNSENISTSENEYEMGPGTVFHLEPGETIHFGNPNIPTAGFDTFMKTLCTLIGSAVEIPYEVLVKSYNSSYSASRGALLEAWEAIKMRRSWFVADFCQPIYELWLSEAVARGRIKAPGFFSDPAIRDAWCKADWIGPVQGHLDPKKEIEAGLTQVENGIKTHEQLTRENGGGDWRSNVERLKVENELLSAAKAVITDTGAQE